MVEVPALAVIAPHETSAAMKAALRARLRADRAYEARQNTKAADALTFRFPEALLDGGVKVAAGYAPIHDEIEPGGALWRLREAGAALALPVVVAHDAPLVFRAFAFGDRLVPDAAGVPAPPPSAAEVRPDLVLTPLLGYDLAGRRLGYGKGFYDRTLAALAAQGPMTAIGLAYEVQRVDRLPDDPHDHRLDWIVTESAAYRISG